MVRTEQGNLPAFWGWVKNAQHGTIRISGVSYDYWTFKTGYATIGVAVTSSAPNVPVYHILEGPDRTTRSKFETWNTDAPKDLISMFLLLAIKKLFLKNLPSAVSREAL